MMLVMHVLEVNISLGLCVVIDDYDHDHHEAIVLMIVTELLKLLILQNKC